MTRLNHLLLAAAALVLGAGAARANPSGSLTLTTAQYGNQTTSVTSGGTVVITAGYSVDSLAPGQSFHVEIDICNPGYGVTLNNGGTQANLPSCVDGIGGTNAIRVSSPTLSAGGSSTGITGTFTIESSTASGIPTNGEAWAIPARIVLNGTGGGNIATATANLTIIAAPSPTVGKYADFATQLGDGSTNVTWEIYLGNEVGLDGTSVDYGTTTATDVIPAGASYVSGSFLQENGTLTAGSPFWATINPNSNGQIAYSNGVITMSIDNLATDSMASTFVQFTVVINYPANFPAPNNVVSNTATATFPGGVTASSTGEASISAGGGGPLGPAQIGFLYKTHKCPGGVSASGYQGAGYSSRNGNQPNFGDNLDCVWAPQAILSFDVELIAFTMGGNSVPLTDGDVIDTLPAEVTLSSIDSVNSGWNMFTSDDATCTASSAWVPLTVSSPPLVISNPAIHCLRFTQGAPIAGDNGHYYFSYSTQLSATEQANLGPGAYEFVDNTITLTASTLLEVNDNAGSSGTVDLPSTFWNMNAPVPFLTSAYDSEFTPGPAVQIGLQLPLTADIPFSPVENAYSGTAAINAFTGFNNLSFSGTLPPELDLTGPLTLSGGVDAAGNPLKLSCTWSPQNRSTPPVIPATYACTVVDHNGDSVVVPAALPGIDPFTACAPPDYCTDFLNEGTSGGGGNNVWNEMSVSIPVEVVSGIPGQYISTQIAVWSDNGPIVSTGTAGAFPGFSAASPAYAPTAMIVSGQPQLQVETTATARSVAVGQPANIDLSYSNTGTVATADTTVYDIFGYDAATGNPLTVNAALNCTSDAPIFAGVTHISGSPASTVQYTTDDPTTAATVGAAGLNWSSTPPSNLNTVTGIRFILNSEFSTTPGSYGPVDQPGVEQLTFIAPDDVGKQICSTGAIVADGLNIASSIDQSATVQILATACTTDCNPIAHTGDSQTINTDGNSCGNSVVLDATGSTEATHFVWKEGTTVVATSDAPNYTATAVIDGIGEHTISLYASGASGVISLPASVTITVVDITPPTVTCGTPPSVVNIASDCTTTAPPMTATATDNCDGTLAATCGTYEPGQTAISCSATDSSGNTGTCTVPVNVQSPVPTPSLSIGDGYGDTYSTVGPSGDLCNNTPFTTFYFTWTPGCTPTAGVTATVSYVDSNGQTQQLGLSYSNGNPLYTYDDGLGDGNQYGWVTVWTPLGQFGATIDIAGPFTITLTGTDGSTVSTQAPVSFGPCLCVGQINNGPQMVLYEDLWPSDGDLDFNDQSIVHNFTYAMDEDTGNVFAVQVVFNVLSVGADNDLRNGFYLHLPGITPSMISSIERYTSDGQPSTTISMVQNEVEAVIPIVDDTRTLFGDQNGFINTQFGATPSNGPQTATQVAPAIALVITFSSELYTYDDGLGDPFLDTGAAPYDLFIARTGDYGHQIHLPQFTGTPLMTPGLMDSADDVSGKNGAANFVNINNLPFAITVPQVDYWPQERVDISNLYPGIVQFTQSGGQEAWDWYFDDSGNGSTTPPPNLNYGVGLPGDPYGSLLPTAGPGFAAGYCGGDD